MEHFEIPPEYCIIVRSFSEGATIRQAANALKCDPASLVRKVQTISKDYGLLEKTSGHWTLTDAGVRCIHWLEQSIASQKTHMSMRSRIRVSTTMWLAEQLIIPNYQSLCKETGDRFFWTIQTTDTNFEEKLLTANTDFVIACHGPYDPGISHKKVAKENLSIIVPLTWVKRLQGLNDREKIQFLSDNPFIRHLDVDPNFAVELDKVTLHPTLQLDSFVSVRAAVTAGLGWSCVPKILVKSYLECKLIHEVSMNLRKEDFICLWWNRSRKDISKEVHLVNRWLANAISS